MLSPRLDLLDAEAARDAANTFSRALAERNFEAAARHIVDSVRWFGEDIESQMWVSRARAALGGAKMSAQVTDTLTGEQILANDIPSDTLDGPITREHALVILDFSRDGASFSLGIITERAGSRPAQVCRVVDLRRLKAALTVGG